MLRNRKNDLIEMLNVSLEENNVKTSFCLARKVYDGFMSKILELLKLEDNIRIPELGIFEYRKTKKRPCTLPTALGKETREGKILKFKASKGVKFVAQEEKKAKKKAKK